MVHKVKNRLIDINERKNRSQKVSKDILSDGTFSVSDKFKAEYDMWSWIYQEISNLRLEVSRLGTYVRINNQTSPGYLEPYHSHIYSLLLPLSVMIPDDIWVRIELKWLEIKKQISEFLKSRRTVPNKKIPFTLIFELDKLYRIALLAAQKAGLGIRASFDTDLDSAIEQAITGT